MDLAFTAQLSSRTSISGSQLSAPEFPSAISQFITLFFSYTEVQCVKSSFCFNFVSQDLINHIFAKVKYTHFNMSNNTKEPHIHTPLCTWSCPCLPRSWALSPVRDPPASQGVPSADTQRAFPPIPLSILLLPERYPCLRCCRLRLLCP